MTIVRGNQTVFRRGTWPVLVWLVACLSVSSVAAQNDFYPLPERSPSAFGFPWPPPAPDEPGVTLTRRYMLDGFPDLEFRIRPEDELWLVSSRNMSGICNDPGCLICKRSRGDQWDRVPLAEDPGARQVSLA